MAENAQDDVMVAAAWMYYDDGLTHEQIAKKLNLSRIKVTRLLQKALSDGIVQFKINRPLPRQFELERRLQQAFGLERAVLVRTRAAQDDTLEEMGRVGADELRNLLSNGCRLGVGWSTTVSRIAPYFEAPRPGVVCVVNEIVGGYPGHALPYSISVQIARRFSAPLEALPVPAFVTSAQARDAILREQSVRKALDNARKCDIAIVGLGDVSPTCTMVTCKYLTVKQMSALKRRGGVGDILGYYYDIHGQLVPSPLDARRIGIDWDDLRRIPCVVAMAAGPAKVAALLGALNGKLCHCLISDTDMAQALLQHQDGARAG
jgi:DNA-binding transcriptional regulator LsrR (DeoR family)